MSNLALEVALGNVSSANYPPLPTRIPLGLSEKIAIQDGGCKECCGMCGNGKFEDCEDLMCEQGVEATGPKKFTRWALKNHPDKGGDSQTFARVSNCKDEGIFASNDVCKKVKKRKDAARKAEEKRKKKEAEEKRKKEKEKKDFGRKFKNLQDLGFE